MRNYYIIFALGITVGMLLIITVFLLITPEYYTDYRYISYLLTICYIIMSIFLFKGIKSIKNNGFN